MTTCHCGRPAGDARLCRTCIGDLRDALRDLPFLLRELETVLTRQAVTGTRNGPRSNSRPLPFHAAASDCRMALTRALEAAAARLIRDDCPRSPQPQHVAAWLLGRLEQLRHHAYAETMHHEILTPVEKARWLIDRAPDRWYAGPCVVCTRDLYAETGHSQIQCEDCGASYDVHARRAKLLKAAADHLANAATIARAVTWLGEEPVTPKRIGMWAHRKRLVARGHEPYPSGTDPTRTRPLYRVGDVLELLGQEARRGSKRT